MSGDEFYGPALPPGFTKGSSGTQSPEAPPVLSSSRKRRHRSSSSDSSRSSASSGGSERQNDSRRKSSEKEPPKLSAVMFGPALPAGFPSASQTISEESSFIGPVLPPTAVTAAVKQADDDDDDVDDGVDDIGPSPALNTESKTQSTIEQIESRAQLMKDKLEGKDQPDPASEVKKREDWMVELPPEMTKNFGVTARKFSTKTETSVDKDRSAWTDTPADRARKEQERQKSKVEKKADAQEEQKVSAADQQYREQVDEYNRLTRPKSLLEMHEDKIKHKSHHKKKKKKKSKDDKEKKSKKKKSKKRESEEETKVERRPFDRDKDLAIPKMDDAQRKSVISRSKELGGRFGHGATQFL